MKSPFTFLMLIKHALASHSCLHIYNLRSRIKRRLCFWCSQKSMLINRFARDPSKLSAQHLDSPSHRISAPQTHQPAAVGKSSPDWLAAPGRCLGLYRSATMHHAFFTSLILDFKRCYKINLHIYQVILSTDILNVVYVYCAAPPSSSQALSDGGQWRDKSTRKVLIVPRVRIWPWPQEDINVFVLQSLLCIPGSAWSRCWAQSFEVAFSFIILALQPHTRQATFHKCCSTWMSFPESRHVCSDNLGGCVAFTRLHLLTRLRCGPSPASCSASGIHLSACRHACTPASTQRWGKKLKVPLMMLTGRKTARKRRRELVLYHEWRDGKATVVDR